MKNSVSFSAMIAIININPYVIPTDEVLEHLFKQAKKNKGPIPVKGTLNSKPFKQTLVKYAGAWRLYLNRPMRTAAGIDVGDRANVEIAFDSSSRTEPMNADLALVLAKNKKAAIAFEFLIPSRKKEILRYLNSLKSEEALKKNIEMVVSHLLGKKQKYTAAFLR